MDAREKTDKHVHIAAWTSGREPNAEPLTPKRDRSDIRRIPCGGGYRIIRKPLAVK